MKVPRTSFSSTRIFLKILFLLLIVSHDLEFLHDRVSTYSSSYNPSPLSRGRRRAGFVLYHPTL
jgi:hypothetical protein